MADMGITIPCAKCRKSTLKPLSELERGDKVICPYCGDIIDLTKQYWQTALRAARKSADEIDSKTN